MRPCDVVVGRRTGTKVASFGVSTLPKASTTPLKSGSPRIEATLQPAPYHPYAHTAYRSND